jgi:serine/threonine protein kinase
MRLIDGRYELSEEIGVGGMAAVWLATDHLLRRPVAIKEVRFGGAKSTAGASRAVREARAAAALNHANIVPIYDVVRGSGQPLIVMHAVDGETLRELVFPDEAMEIGEVARIGRCLASALDAAHRAGIIHRDVKPANVMLDQTGHVWLTDFGVARVLRNGTLTADGLIGSPGYAAPEQVLGEAAHSPADVFGLGATLYYAVEGVGPFGRADPQASLVAPVVAPARKPERAGWLGPILLRMLARHPADRPTLDEVSQALVTRRLPARYQRRWTLLTGLAAAASAARSEWARR